MKSHPVENCDLHIILEHIVNVYKNQWYIFIMTIKSWLIFFHLRSSFIFVYINRNKIATNVTCVKINMTGTRKEWTVYRVDLGFWVFSISVGATKVFNQASLKQKECIIQSQWKLVILILCFEPALFYSLLQNDSLSKVMIKWNWKEFHSFFSSVLLDSPLPHTHHIWCYYCFFSVASRFLQVELPASHLTFKFRVVLLDLVPTKARELILLCYLTHSSREKW